MQKHTKEEILAGICELLEKDFDIEREKLVPEAKLFEDLDLDSIDAIDMVVRLKQKTGLEIGADDFKSIRTLGDVAGVIERLFAEQAK